MLKKQTQWMILLFLAGDLITTCGAFLIAFYLRFSVEVIPVTKNYPPLSQYVKLLPLIAIIWIIVFNIKGLYRMDRRFSKVDEWFSVFIACAISVILLMGSLLYYKVYYKPDVAPEFEYSRAVFGLFLILNVVLTGAARFGIEKFIEHLRARGYSTRRVLIAGAGDLGRTVADKILSHRELGYHIVGFTDDDPEKLDTTYRNLRVLGELADTRDIVLNYNVDYLYIALPVDASRRMLDLIKRVSAECVEIRIVPDLLQYITIRAGVEDLEGVPIINLNETPLQGWNVVIKRLADIAVSAAVLLLFLLVFPPIALLIKLTSQGPVFYRQERMGLDGKPFTIFKFRSMTVDAEKHTGGPTWATEDDPRRTGLGKILRRLSLDELPQFFNVLKGDMSIVGPRPERPAFVNEFKKDLPHYMLRHRVKAGITGWAQVNGLRGDTSIKKRLEYDLYYIENWSLSFDFKILWMTLWNSVVHKNAY
jgi:Undecaprenyl-phosphate glucose phosphotransferase